MTAPSLHECSVEPAPLEWCTDRPHGEDAPWSFTARTDPDESDIGLVVYRLPLSRLGIDDLTRDVSACCGAREGWRWRHERAQEYVLRLRDQLRVHLATSEFIIHVADDEIDEHLQVVVTVSSGDSIETARLEQETADRVRAIAKHAWIGWSEGLRLTMATLQSLDGTV